MSHDQSFRHWAELLPQAVIDIDRSGKVTYLNAKALDVLGYSFEDVTNGLDASVLMVTDCHFRTGTCLQQAVADASNAPVEVMMRHKDGTEFPVLACGAPVIENGEEVAIRLLLIDVPEGKKIGNLLEGTYGKVMEKMREVYYRCDLTGKLLAISSSGARLAGYDSPDAMIGLNIGENFWVDPGQRRDFVRQLLDEGEVHNFEITLRRRDGDLVPCLVNSHVLRDREGNPVGLEGIVTDIIDRKRVEDDLRESRERLASLLEHSPDIIVNVDRDGTILFLNRTISLSSERVIGRNLYEFIPRTSWKTFRRGIERAFHSGKSSRRTVMDITNGFTFDCRLVPVKKDGLVETVMIIATDVTAQKKTEHELKYRSDFESLIGSISTSFISLSNAELDKGISDALRQIGEFVGVDRSYVCLFDKDPSKMSISHEWCSVGTEPQIDNLQSVSIEPLRWSMKKLERLETLHIPSVEDLPPEAAFEKQFFQSQDIQSLVLVPMSYGGSFMGFIGFDAVRVRRVWDEDHVRLLRIVGEIIVNALVRREAARSLDERDQQLRMIYENVNDEIAYVDENGFIKDVNPRVKDIFGFSPEEVIGRNIAEIAFATPDVVSDMIEMRNQSLQSGLAPLVSFEARRKDGSAIFVEASTSFVERDGERNSLVIVRDITDRRRAEQALMESEERFRGIIENWVDAVLIVDADGNIKYESPAYCQMLGYSAREATAEGLLAPVHPDDMPLAQLGFDEALADPEKVVDIEIRVRHKDGSWRAIHVLANNLMDVPGVGGLVVYLRDITERKQAEEALHESEQRFKLIAETMVEGVYLVDGSGNYLFVNDAYADIVGWSREELLGHHYYTVIPDETIPIAAEITRKASAGEPQAGEYILRHKSGRDIPVYFSMVQLPLRDQMPGFAGIIQDITERKHAEQALRNAYSEVEARVRRRTAQLDRANKELQAEIAERKQAEEALRDSEERWRSLVTNAMAYIMMLAPDGTIVSMNRAFPGFREENVIGTHCLDYVPPREKKKVKDLLARTFEEGVAHQDEIYIEDNSGQHTWFHISVSPVVRRGKVTAAIYVATDITQRKRDEQKLKQYAAKLRQANEDLARYAHVASHDICAPLRAIRYYTHLVRKEFVDAGIEDSHGYLDTIDRAIQEGESLAENLLRLSRLGERGVRIEQIDIGALILKLIDEMGLQPDVEIVLSDKWPKIRSDRTLVTQIFRNLLDNAVKFNPEHPKRVEIGWRPTRKSGYEFYVHDNGPGISPEHQQRIFRPFEQLHHRNQVEGYGIGLAIVKKAVGRLGGKVRLESKPGEGSSFFITLPS